MLSAQVYTIHHAGRRTAQGVTRPILGSVKAILKSDGDESPQCVYSELVAVRLARLLYAPLAEGVLVSGKNETRYASLMLAAEEGYLPDLSSSRIAKVAQLYPFQAAGLLAFDLWIGNWDRASNIKASIRSPKHPIFCGFDHSHALLSVEEDPVKSVARLASPDVIVTFHPFFGHAIQPHVDTWTKRIAGLPELLIRAACELGAPLNTVSVNLQRDLADALVCRSLILPDLARAACDGAPT